MCIVIVYSITSLSHSFLQVFERNYNGHFEDFVI